MIDKRSTLHNLIEEVAKERELQPDSAEKVMTPEQGIRLVIHHLEQSNRQTQQQNEILLQVLTILVGITEKKNSNAS